MSILIDTSSPVARTSPGAVGIVSAMEQEIRALRAVVQEPKVTRIAGRDVLAGRLGGQPVVLVRSGIGKVAAAASATLLVQAFEVSRVLFTGVAGGLGTGVRVGDVVVANELLQHDMDASPIFPRFEVPLTGRARFPADHALSEAVARAAASCLARAPDTIGAAHLASFGIQSPKVHRGLVASGDRFVSSDAEGHRLLADLPDLLAVDMEGAAVAQVCADFGCPFAMMRTISDRADDQAHVDFPRFITEVASLYTRIVVEEWLRGGGATG